MQIAENLIYLKKKNGLNRTKLSHEININESLLRAIETGSSKNPRIDTVAKIAAYFEISIDDLIYKDLEKEEPDTDNHSENNKGGNIATAEKKTHSFSFACPGLYEKLTKEKEGIKNDQ